MLSCFYLCFSSKYGHFAFFPFHIWAGIPSRFGYALQELGIPGKLKLLHFKHVQKYLICIYLSHIHPNCITKSYNNITFIFHMPYHSFILVIAASHFLLLLYYAFLPIKWFSTPHPFLICCFTWQHIMCL